MHQKMCYATFLHVWTNKIYQHLLLQSICWVFIKCIFVVVFLIFLLIICPDLCQILKEIYVQTAKIGKIHLPLPSNCFLYHAEVKFYLVE